MSEFKEIKTQEDFDTAIKERLARENKKYEGYTSPDDLATMKKEYEEKIAKYESDSVKTRIANEMGLPSSIASRLKGSNEEEIRKDAESFAGFFQKEPPLATGEQTVANEDQARNVALKKLLKNLRQGD